MALRIQLFSVPAGTRSHHIGEHSAVALDEVVAAFDAGAHSPLPDIACAGWVSASDTDEDDLVELATAIAERAVCQLHVQGRGCTPADSVTAVLADMAQSGLDPPLGRDLQRAWLGALQRIVAKVGDGGHDLCWRTTYDAAGSTDSGEEFPSGFRAP